MPFHIIERTNKFHGQDTEMRIVPIDYYGKSKSSLTAVQLNSFIKGPFIDVL